MAVRPLRDRQWRTAGTLAVQDFLHEWPVSLCLIFALAAVLSPLLVLFGLKSGIVTTMRERLKADPLNRELVIRGHHTLTPAWFETMAARRDIGFLVAKTRRLAATITLETAAGQTLPDLDMLPTAAGDPLFPADVQPPAGRGQVVLSHTAATKLQAARGTAVEGLLTRRLDGEAQAVRVPLVVTGVLPETAFGGDVAFVSLPLLVAAEDYRDGMAVTDLGVTKGERLPAPARPFASARLYAAGLDDVAPLAEVLRAQGIEVVTRAREIETVQAIDRVLTVVFVVLAGIGVVGYLLSLAASLWANVDRKRRDIALLRLVGIRTGPLIAFPATQAALVAFGGVAMSAAAYAGVATVFNRIFAAQLGRDELVCRLEPADAAIAAGLTLLCAFLASAAGGFRAVRIDPAEHLREL